MGWLFFCINGQINGKSDCISDFGDSGNRHENNAYKD